MSRKEILHYIKLIFLSLVYATAVWTPLTYIGEKTYALIRKSAETIYDINLKDMKLSANGSLALDISPTLTPHVLFADPNTDRYSTEKIDVFIKESAKGKFLRLEYPKRKTYTFWPMTRITLPMLRCRETLSLKGDQTKEIEAYVKKTHHTRKRIYDDYNNWRNNVEEYNRYLFANRETVTKASEAEKIEALVKQGRKINQEILEINSPLFDLKNKIESRQLGKGAKWALKNLKNPEYNIYYTIAGSLLLLAIGYAFAKKDTFIRLFLAKLLKGIACAAFVAAVFAIHNIPETFYSKISWRTQEILQEIIPYLFIPALIYIVLSCARQKRNLLPPKNHAAIELETLKREHRKQIIILKREHKKQIIRDQKAQEKKKTEGKMHPFSMLIYTLSSGIMTIFTGMFLESFIVRMAGRMAGRVIFDNIIITGIISYVIPLTILLLIRAITPEGSIRRWVLKIVIIGHLLSIPIAPLMLSGMMYLGLTPGIPNAVRVIANFTLMAIPGFSIICMIADALREKKRRRRINAKEQETQKLNS